MAGAFFIAVERIQPDPSQPRKTVDAEKIEELAASIRKLGILQPITVRYVEEDNIYRIIAGERRFQAAKAAGLPEIPCWEQKPKAEDILVHQIVENWQRVELEPLEIARALGILRDANRYSQRQLAELTDKPESEISRLLKMLTMPAEAQRKAQANEAGLLTRRHIVNVARLPDEEQVAMLSAVETEHLTATETEKRVRKRLAQGQSPRPLSNERKFTTKQGIVRVSFRRREATDEAVLAALEEVRRQLQTAGA